MSDTPVPPPPSSPQPQGASQEQRNWAMAAHLSALAASFVGLAVLGPLVVWLVKKDEDQFIGAHAREALNFQLTWLAIGFVGGIVGFVIGVVTLGLGFILLALVGGLFALAWLALMVVAAVKASNGEHYRYPLTVRLIS